MKLDEEVKRAKKRVDDMEEHIETEKEKHGGVKQFGIAVSDLVSLLHQKADAEESGDTARVEKLNKDYPFLQATNFLCNYRYA